MSDLAALALAIFAGTGVLVVVLALLGGRGRQELSSRLVAYESTAQRRSLEEIELSAPLFDRTIRPVARRLSGIGRRLTGRRTASRTAVRLAAAGDPGRLRTAEFLGVKVLVALVVGGVLAGILVLLTGSVTAAIFGAPIGGLVGFVAPEIYLGRRIRARRRAIVLTLPDTLDLLTISVRAGLGFDAALAKVVERTSGPLADELRRVLGEIRMGRPRREALRDLAARAEVPALSAFVSAIVQAEQLGVPISRVLQVQSDQLRTDRRQRAEEMAAKAPIKMMFPLVGCIFPSIFIVILGPALILIVGQLGSM